jgi:hypothetical protein
MESRVSHCKLFQVYQLHCRTGASRLKAASEWAEKVLHGEVTAGLRMVGKLAIITRLYCARFSSSKTIRAPPI